MTESDNSVILDAVIDYLRAEGERRDAILRKALDEQQRISAGVTIVVALIASSFSSALWAFSFLLFFVVNENLRAVLAIVGFTILSGVFLALAFLNKPFRTWARVSLTRLARRFKS